RSDAVPCKKLGKEPQHDLAVLEHVGDPGGRAGVVFEHIEGVGMDAHDVDAGDVNVDVVRHLLAVHLRPEHRVLEHQVLGHDARLQDFAAAVDVAKIRVQRLDALFETAPQRVPLGGRQNTGDHVE